MVFSGMETKFFKALPVKISHKQLHNNLES
jgi:hypothetical protein